MNGNVNASKASTWVNVSFLVLALITLLILSWYFLSLPESHFQTHEKRLTVIAKWLVAILAFFGIKFAVKKPIYDIFGLWPVRTVIGVVFVFCLAVIAPVHSIVVDSVPPGADIYLDPARGSRGTTPQKIGGLRLQMYDLTLSKQGYHDKILAVSFSQVLMHARIDEPLDPIAGKLSIRTDPVGAEVTINGVDHGKSPVKLELPAGIYTVALKKDGFREVVRGDVEVSADEERVLSVALDSLVTYQVMILSYPTGADIYIDGRPAGTTNTAVDLGRGFYEVRLQRDDQTIAKSIDVPRQREVSVVFE